MSAANLEVVRELYRGWARGDFNVGLDHFAPDIEFISDIHGRGRHSGAEVVTPNSASAFRFCEGKIAWMFFTDQLEHALEAVALRK